MLILMVLIVRIVRIVIVKGMVIVEGWLKLR